MTRTTASPARHVPDGLTTHLRHTFFAEWLDWYWATDGTSGVTTAHGRRAARPHRR